MSPFLLHEQLDKPSLINAQSKLTNEIYYLYATLSQLHVVHHRGEEMHPPKLQGVPAAHQRPVVVTLRFPYGMCMEVIEMMIAGVYLRCKEFIFHSIIIFTS